MALEDQTNDDEDGSAYDEKQCFWGFDPTYPIGLLTLHS